MVTPFRSSISFPGYPALRRLSATVMHDAMLQFRNGFYGVSVFFVLLWLGLFSLIPDSVELNAALIIPAFLLMNLLITTFYFVGALVLLEKSEGTLTGLITTPLRSSEYLWSRLLTLMVLGVVESLLIVVPNFGVQFHWLPLLAGAALLGGIYTLLGFVAIVRYDSINEYLIPSMGFVILLMLPLTALLGMLPAWLFAVHPLMPALVLMQTAFDTAPGGGQIVYAVAGSILWFALCFLWAQRLFYRFVIAAAGGGQ